MKKITILTDKGSVIEALKTACDRGKLSVSSDPESLPTPSQKISTDLFERIFKKAILEKDSYFLLTKETLFEIVQNVYEEARKDAEKELADEKGISMIFQEIIKNL